MGRRLYHLTHGENLASIVASGRLLCKHRLQRESVEHNDIARPGIQEQRRRVVVPCGPGGDLHDYVPFFFAPRPPMLYALLDPRRPGGPVDERAMIHLVSDVDKIRSRKLGTVFTDGHAVMQFTHFYDDLDDLPRLSWDIIESRDWRDTNEQPDRKRRKQAEFLVADHVPWAAVVAIGVREQGVANRVAEILEASGHDYRPEIRIRPDWYYHVDRRRR